MAQLWVYRRAAKAAAARTASLAPPLMAARMAKVTATIARPHTSGYIRLSVENQLRNGLVAASVAAQTPPAVPFSGPPNSVRPDHQAMGTTSRDMRRERVWVETSDDPNARSQKWRRA